ncbi:MAG TPA: EamA family transporter, partial [Ilumatobacteraceae bacterium]|nr:EamA family transporter [Ilumatobacteraceae bacterium]
GLITFVNPVVAVALGALFLDEEITTATVVGFLLVMTGCWLATRPPPADPVIDYVDIDSSRAGIGSS